ncbi:hypothetical protein C0991_001503, partial [Blastosporella zonata]
MGPRLFPLVERLWAECIVHWLEPPVGMGEGVATGGCTDKGAVDAVVEGFEGVELELDDPDADVDPELVAPCAGAAKMSFWAPGRTILVSNDQ